MKAIIIHGLGGSGGFRNRVRIWRNGLHTLTKNSQEYPPPCPPPPPFGIFSLFEKVKDTFSLNEDYKRIDKSS